MNNPLMGTYQLDPKCIGKGGFGEVYRALNIHNGRTVAIKRIKLHDVPDGELESIEGEIELLKRLRHPNIVAYVETMRTTYYLHIILEFVENGSLSDIVKKFGGSLPESLVAMYVSQVLVGLDYLHSQGVIHRDIKGANILATKSGEIKLADFGVATLLNEGQGGEAEDNVVGTPYWMAPEVIEMSGQQGTACDIWSVGCTAVELIVGEPPYFDLAPMPALFRIVQDEHPPIPPGLSPSLKDFLLQCWQKDPNLRINAKELLKHPWLRACNLPTVAAAAEQTENQFISTLTETLKISPDDMRNKLAAMQPASTNGQAPVTPSSQQQTLGTEGKASADGATDESSDKEQSQSESESEESDWDVSGDESDDANSVPSITQLTPSIKNTLRKSTLKKFQESNNDDDDDDWGDLDLANIDLGKRLQAKKATAWSDQEDSDGEMDDDLWNEDVTKMDEREKGQAELLQLLKQLQPKQKELVIIKGAQRLEQMFSDSKNDPAQIVSMLTSHGVIPIMETLEVQNEDVLRAVLSVVTKIVSKNEAFLQSLCLVGLIPAVHKLLQPCYSTDVRLQAGSFVKRFCTARKNDFTRQMFIACGGLSSLILFFDENYQKNKKLVFMGVECVELIFKTPNHPKNDFCRLLSKFGLLSPLVRALFQTGTDADDPIAAANAKRIAKILLLFAQGDPVVKEYMAMPNVIQPMLLMLAEFAPDTLAIMMKAIRSLSMDPHTLDPLEKGGAIPRIVPLLSNPLPDIQNQAILTMFYMMQIKTSRQEEAALSGVIPHLQRIIRTNHPLKQFAFPMICKLAHASIKTLGELKKYDGVNFYLDMLQQHHWQMHAIDSLAVWLSAQTPRVEMIMLQSHNIAKLLRVFTTTQRKIFESVLQGFIKIVSTSVAVNQALGRNSSLIECICQRLLESNDAYVRKHLLTLTNLIFQRHNDQRAFVSSTGLMDVLRSLQSSDKILIQNLADRLIKEFSKHI